MGPQRRKALGTGELGEGKECESPKCPPPKVPGGVGSAPGRGAGRWGLRAAAGGPRARPRAANARQNNVNPQQMLEGVEEVGAGAIPEAKLSQRSRWRLNREWGGSRRGRGDNGISSPPLTGGGPQSVPAPRRAGEGVDGAKRNNPNRGKPKRGAGIWVRSRPAVGDNAAIPGSGHRWPQLVRPPPKPGRGPGKRWRGGGAHPCSPILASERWLGGGVTLLSGVGCAAETPLRTVRMGQIGLGRG